MYCYLCKSGVRSQSLKDLDLVQSNVRDLSTCLPPSNPFSFYNKQEKQHKLHKSEEIFPFLRQSEFLVIFKNQIWVNRSYGECYLHTQIFLVRPEERSGQHQSQTLGTWLHNDSVQKRAWIRKACNIPQNLFFLGNATM